MATEYRVFKQIEDSTWEKVGTFPGATHRQAIKAAVEKLGPESSGSTFAAVAENRWSEETVQVETNPRVKFA